MSRQSEARARSKKWIFIIQAQLNECLVVCFKIHCQNSADDEECSLDRLQTPPLPVLTNLAFHMANAKKTKWDKHFAHEKMGYY